jgi:hypothetical protein
MHAESLVLYDTDSTEGSNSPNVVHIRCHGHVSTEPLPSNDNWGCTNIEADKRDL